MVIAYRRNKTGGEYDAEIEISKNRTFTGLCLTAADKSIGVYFDPISRRFKTDKSQKNWEKAFSWEKDWERLAAMPRQAEWEAFVAKAQGADPSLPSHKKWRMMEKIFELEK